ncbi:unnamed protein product [Chilo suppressalis]|uniref:LRRCT domain-containing protein n=1 Tax=Chilo suppressalis TaxID=168631 RepID=A0ABN8B905_CHISP|nr:unnamed protein product [Chilo suppressalis]
MSEWIGIKCDILLFLMDPGDIILVTAWMWLLPLVVQAGTIRRKREERDDISPCLTYKLNSLIHIDCTNRDLTELPDGLNTNVQVLLLSNNDFMSFPSQLEQFTQLQILDFSANHLSTPLPSYMERLHQLHTLNLSNNNYDVWMTSQTKARKLDLSKNKINNIEEGAFNQFTELRHLDLSENRIRDLPLTMFQSTKNLETLLLSRNYFSVIPKFQSHSLKSLHLSNCQISEIHQNSIGEMVSLVELFLSMNAIEAIPDNFSSNTLQELDLSYNDIDTINDNSFSSLPHLAVLDLRGNNFKEVWSTSHFASNPFLREVRVKGNRWSCEGFHLNLLLTYEFLTKDPPKVTDTGSLICYSPANVTQMSWQQAYIRTWHPNQEVIVSYTSLAVFIGVIIGVIITSCICRTLIPLSSPEPVQQTTVLNVNGPNPQPTAETVLLRVPLHEEDLPPSYDEALLMPRLNSSFHSLPDFVEEEEEDRRRYRRSRSIGDLTEQRPRTHDRRSTRRTLQINTNNNDNEF